MIECIKVSRWISEDNINDEKKVNKNIQKLIHNKLEQITIKDAFNGDKFNKFRKFCNDSNIKNISDISQQQLQEFFQVKGVGETRLKNVRDKILSIIKPIVKKINKYNNDVISLNDEIYKSIKDFKIQQVFSILKIPYYEGDYYFHEIQGKNYKEVLGKENIKNLEDVENLDRGIQLLNMLKSPKDISNSVIGSLGEKEKHILNSIFIDNLTLRETSRDMDLSTEGVRLVKNNTVDNIIDSFYESKFIESFRLFTNDKQVVFISELEKILGENNKIISNIIKRNNIEWISYFEPLDIIYFKMIQPQIDRMKKYILSLPSMFLLEDHINNIRSILSTIHKDCLGIEKIERVFNYFGYRAYGRYFSNKKVSRVEMLEVLLRDYIKKPIKMDDSSMIFICRMCKKIFNYKLIENTKVIDARLRDIDNIILVGPRTFCHINNFYYDKSIIDQASEYIDKEFEKRKVINIKEVFLKFKDVLIQYDIKDKRALYSLIRYHLGGKYNIGHRNSLNIFRADITKKLTLEDKVIHYLKKRDGIASKEEVKKLLGGKQYKFNNVISVSDSILLWGNNEVILVENIQINQKIINKIRNLLYRVMTQGFTTGQVVLKEMLFDDELKNFLNVNKIDNYKKLNAILRYEFKNLKGRGNFICDESSKFHSFKDVLIHKYRDVTFRNEMRDFIMDYGYKSFMSRNFIDNLIKNKEYIRISKNEILPKDKFNLSKEVTVSTCQYILDKMKGKEYISLSNLKDYEGSLPKINYKWNAYLIKAILEENGFKSVFRHGGDYRYDRVIVVREESEIENFEDLLYYILKYEYNGDLEESKVYEYLTSTGILWGTKSKYYKKMPSTVRDFKKITIDNRGRIQLA